MTEKCQLHRRSSDDGRVCPESVEAADAAVKKVFAILGVDIDKPESVEEFRENLRFGKRLRRASDHGTLVFIAAVVSALTYASWVGIVATAKGLK
jgi:hypothetical protein